jgi:hypothetical protein
MAKAIIYEAELDETFWAEMIGYSSLVLNLLPSAAIGDQIPYEELRGRKANYGPFRIFGSTAYAWIPVENRTSLRQMQKRWCLWEWS